MTNVTLQAISQPVSKDIPSTGALLAYFARVSSTSNQMNHKTGGNLLRSLVKRKEWSPLEMVSLTIEINTTRDIARQILRHRSFSFQEFSQRYAEVTDPPVYREARIQHATDRQMSLELKEEGDLEGWWMLAQSHIANQVAIVYGEALDKGIAKEVARAILPEGMTPSKLYMAGNLRSWLHYCFLRCDPKTQKEHRLIAEQCRQILIDQFPDIADVIRNEED